MSPIRIRLLLIINDLRIGGAERLVADLAPRLRELGIDAEVYVLGRNLSHLEEQIHQSDVPFHSSNDNLSLRSPLQITRLAYAMRGFDIIHVQLFPAQLWVALAARLLPGRQRPLLVTTEQNTHNRRRKLLFRPLDKWMYAQFDRIVAITEATADALVNWVPAARKKMVVIHNAIPLEKFRDAQPADRKAIFGIGDSTPLITCVGRLEPQKDHDTLIRALALLPGVHLALIGDGYLRSDVERLAANLDIRERIHFLGHRSDVASLLKISDVYVQPSRWEGFGIAVVEAMAAGVPVVVSDVPGVREVAGDAGRKVTAGNPEALAEAIRVQLAESGSERAVRVASGLAQASRYQIGICVNEHIALYENLLAKRR